MLLHKVWIWTLLFLSVSLNKGIAENPSTEKIIQETYEQFTSSRSTPTHKTIAIDSKTILHVSSPVRIELSSQLSSDLIAITQLKKEPTEVLNVSIQIDKKNPIHVFIRRIPDKKILLRSIDLGLIEDIQDLHQLSNLHSLQDPLCLLKASLFTSGLIDEQTPLATQLERLGGGFSITTYSSLPKGTGLGVSGILSAAILKGLYTMVNENRSKDDLIKDAIIVEKLIGVGGGWQDPAGGIYGGVKLLAANPIEKKIQVLPIQLSKDTQENLQKRMIVWYSGKGKENATRGFSQEVHHFLNPDKKVIYDQAKQNLEKMKQALMTEDIDAFGLAIKEYYELGLSLDFSTGSSSNKGLPRTIEEDTIGYNSTGVGASGGFCIFISKEGQESSLHEKISLLNGKIYNWNISNEGMKIEYIYEDKIK
ncbi:MAG: hypothetical protein WCP39_01485 [Chlamydiota bacterium]